MPGALLAALAMTAWPAFVMAGPSTVASSSVVCSAALSALCSDASAKSQCEFCCGAHQHELRAASCSAAECEAHCNRPSPAFQPYSAQGNTIHVATADLDGVGVRDFVVAGTTEGRISAYQRPDTITDPVADNRLWSVETGVFAMHLASAKLDCSSGAKDHLLAPGADGRLRVLDAVGNLVHDIAVGPTNGSVYAADAGFTSKGVSRIVASGVNGNIYVYHGETGKLVGQYRPRNTGSIVRRLVVGNYDGVGGDEVAVFFNRGGSNGGGFLTFIDLDTLEIASYWQVHKPVICRCACDSRAYRYSDRCLRLQELYG